MANTHRAVIEHLDNTVTLIAAGPQALCEEMLEGWVAKHPLDIFDTPLILAVAFPAKPERAHRFTTAYIARLLTTNN